MDLIGCINADMIGTKSEPGEHVDWNAPEFYTTEEWAWWFNEPIEEVAASTPHLIFWEV